MSYIVEQDIEDAAIEILVEDLGYTYLYGPDIAPNGKNPLREKWDDVVLIQRLVEAIDSNPKNKHLPQDAKDDALKKVLRHSSPKLVENNEIFHKYLVEGIDVEYREGSRIKGDKVYLLDTVNPYKNDFLVVNQFTIIEDKHERRPDLILFVNGLPLIVVELKNPADKNATIINAYDQIQTYKKEISSLFNFNEGIIVADGTHAKAGTLSSTYEWFMPWRIIDGINREPNSKPQLEVLLKGMCNKEVLIDLITNFTGFMKTKKDTIKIIAGYHQYFGAKNAIEKTVESVNQTDKDKKKAGVLWHTQGSGKSLTMVFYAGKIAKDLRLKNPTLLFLTDRNDLDQNLFDTFSDYNNLLRETPKKIKTQSELKQSLKVDSGGVFFTTIQKFLDQENKSEFELLSKRDNIIVIADEAHRTQYGFKGKIKKNVLRFGLAKYIRDALPNASFLGFTGTPIDLADKSTRAVFGEYIKPIYDMQAALEDNRVVKIYYDSKLVRISKNDEVFENLDDDVDEITEFEESNKRDSLKSRWARIEALLGTEPRIKTIAKTFVRHFENRQSVMDGKAMIVCASRRICVDLHDELKKLKPEWYNKDDDKGVMKVVMTGSAKDKDWQEHIRDKKRRKELGDYFKESSSDFKIAIVRDMWLTGFDVPSLNTIYIDKEIKKHNLMQAIARVNRVYKDKQGGLVVDFYGIAEELKKAITIYSENGGAGLPTYDLSVAVNLMNEKFNIIEDMLHGYDYKRFFNVSAKEKMRVLPEIMEHILNLENGKKRFIENVTALKKAYSLASSTTEAKEIRDQVAFFEAIANNYKKTDTTSGTGIYTSETAIKQLVSKAVSSKGVIDIYKELNFDKPEISILSDKFLTEMQQAEHKNLAFEALKKLLNDEIRVRFKANKIQNKKFSEKLDEAIKKYQNRSIDSAQVILELIEIAKEIKESHKRGESLGLSEDEISFYDALSNNESASKILGDDLLKQIARELTNTIRNNTTIDWKFRDAVRSKLKVMVKRLLKKYGYPPDKTLIATELVLEQAEILSDRWVEDNFYSPSYKTAEMLNTSIMGVAEDKAKYNKKEK